MNLVFADTNALIAIHCFEPPKGQKTLAFEVVEAERAGDLTLLICDIVANEVRRVVARSFPDALSGLDPFLEGYGVTILPEPERGLLEQAQIVCVDPDDAPILAAAVQSAERYGAMLLLSNDFETFHTPEMKAFLAEHGVLPVSLYGLLKLVGRR